MKLPHWVQLLLAFAVVAITWVMNEQASGGLVLPSVVVTVLTIVKTAIGMLSDSVPTALAAKRARKVLASAARPAGLCLFMLTLFGCSGCSGAQSSQAVTGGVNLAICVITTVSSDVAAGDPWTQCVNDAVSKCGADAGSVVSIYAAHQAAEVREGFVPKVLIDAGDQ